MVFYGMRSFMPAWTVVFWFLAFVNCIDAFGISPGTASMTQDQDDDVKPGAVRIRGKLTLEQDSIVVDLAGIEMTLEEIVDAPELPLPANFQQLTVEQRQKWFQEFQASDAGKRYQESLQKMDAARRKFTATADGEGKFVFESGFVGTFGLFGQKEFERDGKTFLADFFAEVPVGDGVRFLDLGDLPLSVRRILQVGETAPDIELRPNGESSDLPAKHEVKQYRGKPVLLFFWTRDSLPRIQAEIEKVVEGKPHGLVVVGINLDQPAPETAEFLKNSKFPWVSVFTSGMSSAPCVVDYGIMAIPAFCLLDAKGNVLLNDEGFYDVLSAENATMLDIVTKAVAPN